VCRVQCRRGAHSIFEARDPFPTKIKLNCAFFLITAHHHNSFFNCNNGHCFSAICRLVLFNSSCKSRGLSFEAVFCFSYKRFVCGRSSLNSFCKIRFDIVIAVSTVTCLLKFNFSSMVLKLGSIQPLGFDEAVSGVRRRPSETCNPLLLSVILGKNGVRQNFGKLHKGSVCL